MKSALVLFITSLLMTGCVAATLPDAAPPHIRGTLTTIHPADVSGDALGVVLIEGVREQDTEYDIASVTITKQTRIFERTDGTRRVVTFESLQVGQKVEGWFTSQIATSYPPMATATEIVILK